MGGGLWCGYMTCGCGFGVLLGVWVVYGAFVWFRMLVGFGGLWVVCGTRCYPRGVLRLFFLCCFWCVVGLVVCLFAFCWCGVAFGLYFVVSLLVVFVFVSHNFLCLGVCFLYLWMLCGIIWWLLL